MKITKTTPIKYWGGKQLLLPKILPLIPKHKCYIEPFFGGGALFFAKDKSHIEVINDINDNMVNFYKTVKKSKSFDKLCREIDLTLYSEWQHKQAKEIWKKGKGDDKIARALAVFLLSHQSFSGNLGSSWAFSDDKNQAKRFDHVKKNFDNKYLKRLEHTQIFSRDALNVITNTDSKDSFFFIDPPYYNSDCGSYKGYTLNDFIDLLEVLSTLKGKFLLTSYPSDVLSEYTPKNQWNTIKNKMPLSASTKKGATKIEVFTMNYENEEKQLNLFYGN